MKLTSLDHEGRATINTNIYFPNQPFVKFDQVSLKILDINKMRTISLMIAHSLILITKD